MSEVCGDAGRGGVGIWGIGQSGIEPYYCGDGEEASGV